MDGPRPAAHTEPRPVRMRVPAVPIAGLAVIAATLTALVLTVSDATRTGPGGVGALDTTLGRLNAGRPVGTERERVLPLVSGRPGFDQYRGNEPHQIAACRDVPAVAFSCEPDVRAESTPSSPRQPRS